VGAITTHIHNNGWYVQRLYRCIGKMKIHLTGERCCNKSWTSKKLEPLVWAELERYLSDYDLIISEIEKQRQDTNRLGVFEAQLLQIERQIKATDHEQHQLLQWALKGFPESQVETENKRINKARETLIAQKVDLEAQLKASQDAFISIPKLEDFVERIQGQLPLLDFEGKRLALDMLGITVWLDGEAIEITGKIDLESDLQTVLPRSRNIDHHARL
jgi:hypothetical protein